MKISFPACLHVLVLLILLSKPLKPTNVLLDMTKSPNHKQNGSIFYDSHPEAYIQDYDYNYSYDNIQPTSLESLYTGKEITEFPDESEKTDDSYQNEDYVQNIYTINNFDENSIPRCPTDLTLYQNEYNRTFCFKITRPSQFPPRCPYPLQIGYYHFKMNNQINLTDHIVWAHAQKSKMGDNFELINTINNDMVNVNQNYEGYINDSKKECLVVNGITLMSVECNEEYHGICIYDMDVSLNDDYCRRKFNETCFNSNLGMPNKCYCINKYNNVQPRSNYCTKLAEITEPYQNILLSKRFVQNEFCWFGLEKNKWISNSGDLKYSYWSSGNNFSKNFGAVGRHGWVLEDDEALFCGLCEINVEHFNDVRLHLTHNFSNHKIQLEIFNALDAFEGVLCLTGNDSHFINLSSSKDNYISQDLWSFDDIKEYCWCKTLQLPNLQKVYSNRIVVSNYNIHGHVFVAIWSFLIIDKGINISTYTCPEIKSDIILHSKVVQSALSDDKQKIHQVCHYYITKNNLTRFEEYEILNQTLIVSNVTLEKLTNAMMCLPTTTTSGNKTLHWHETQIGSTIAAEELCFQENGVPVTRTCGGNYTFGAEWFPVNGSCVDAPMSPTTIFLNDLLYNGTPDAHICTELVRVTSDKTNMDSYQIHLVSELLDKTADEVKNVKLKDVVTTVNNIMQVDKTKLRSSQVTLNSTDTILWSLDKICNRLDDTVDQVGYINENSDKLLMQAASLTKSDIKGFKLQSSDADVFDGSKLKPIHHYSEYDDLEENLDLAVFIPRDLDDSIKQCEGSKPKPTIITSMFFDNALFNEYSTTTGNPDGKILSVLLPGFNCTFSAPIKVIFKSSVNESFEETCASWVYGSNRLMEGTHGRWASEQKPKILGNMSQYRLCEYSHVTHFALLVLGENSNISSTHKKALDIITAVGSGLSILGLIGVFVTAILFKVYRETNGIVINFSIAMTAQIVLLFIADNVGDNKVSCTVFGAFLHYIVLAQFFWMLAIAVLQYQRYVVIFSSPPNHIVVKTCLFAWGIPLIPVIVIVSISTDNYGKNLNGLCYALGHFFTFGVLVPVGLIIIVNVMIFLRIMISVAGSRRIKVHRDKTDTSKLQLRLAFMLFFLLGLTWGFGLLASIGGSVVYSYLFCITATIQGFVLFLFFIVLNEKTRSLWINMKTCCSKYDEYDVNRDSAASVMMRKTKTTSTDTCTDSASSEILRKIKNKGSSEF